MRLKCNFLPHAAPRMSRKSFLDKAPTHPNMEGPNAQVLAQKTLEPCQTQCIPDLFHEAATVVATITRSHFRASTQ